MIRRNVRSQPLTIAVTATRFNAKISVFLEKRPAVMVLSQERSGTHFLMNSLAACYGYVSEPRVDLDISSFNINYFYPPEIADLLLSLATEPLASVVKSHHSAEFFAGELPRITKRYVIFYMIRDPVAVMLSQWRLMHSYIWREGPKVADPLTFARAEPCGQMMRYQMRQYPNMLQRWASHVDGWLKASEADSRIVVVRYEDLNTRYAKTMGNFTNLLERKPKVPMLRPDRNVNVVPGGPEDPSGLGIPPDVDALRELCQTEVGTMMARLGY
jgi:hypothetical protein